MEYDVIVVGCGLCGATLARELALQGKRVLMLERRNHIAGNMYDFTDEETGVLAQKYGPHAFHTNRKELMDYMLQFGEWDEYHLKCMVHMNGKFTSSPFNYQTIDDYFEHKDAEKIKLKLEKEYPNQKQVTIIELLGSTDPDIKRYADFLFENDYKPYTAKQWGMHPDQIDISVLRRVPVSLSYETGYFNDTYQMLPVKGFTEIFKEMLKLPNIDMRLNTDALMHIKVDIDNRLMRFDGQPISSSVIYTGAVDELLGYRFGRLPYRSLRFEWLRMNTDMGQKAALVAYPQAPDFTRITEYNKLPVQKATGKTIMAKEYPLLVDDTNQYEPYYPIPTQESGRMYQQYKETLERISNLYLCGRLADFQYYNMDQALERALNLSRKILSI